MSEKMYRTVGGRNNNPGCIRRGKGYKKYATLEDGYSDLARLLVENYNNRTAYQIFRKYAPSSDGNNPYRYARTVIRNLQKRGLKVGNNTVLDLKNPEILSAVMAEISKVECGGILGSPDLVRQCAYKQLGMPTEYREQRSQLTNEKASRMVQMYYDEVERLGYLSSKAPNRRREASQGIISDNNIPKIEDKNPYGYQKLQAIANVNKALQYPEAPQNGTQTEINSYISMQTDKALKASVEYLRTSIEKKDFRCEQTLRDIICTASIQVAEKAYGRPLNKEEQQKIVTETQNKIKGFNVRENPEKLLAYYDNIQAESEQEFKPKLNPFQSDTLLAGKIPNQSPERALTLQHLSHQTLTSILQSHSQQFEESNNNSLQLDLKSGYTI